MIEGDLFLVLVIRIISIHILIKIIKFKICTIYTHKAKVIDSIILYLYFAIYNMKTFIKYSLIALFIILLSNDGFSQINFDKTAQTQIKFKLISPLDLLYKVPESQATTIIKQRSIFDANQLPLFCKIEHKLSKKSNVNLRMRLGNLDYVNKLEGKN